MKGAAGCAIRPQQSKPTAISPSPVGSAENYDVPDLSAWIEERAAAWLDTDRQDTDWL